jgi:hypothetical protein
MGCDEMWNRGELEWDAGCGMWIDTAVSACGGNPLICIPVGEKQA